MCGRYTLTTDPEELASVFDLVETPELKPRWNIPPTDPVLAIRHSPDGRRRATPMRWGLVPPFAEGPKAGPPLINARSETVHRLRPFRDAFRRRRCLVPADSWFEWRAAQDGKQPYRFVFGDGRPFGMAGLWERWTGAAGDVLESCTVLTVAPNAVASEVHDRMPLILSPSAWAAWFDPDLQDVEPLRAMLVTSPVDDLRYYPVDRRVNSVRNDDAACVTRVPVQASLF